MSVFNRIAGTEGEKIPVWPMMTAFRSLLDSNITDQQFYDKMSLVLQEEKTEFAAYKTAIEAQITGLTAIFRLLFSMDTRVDLSVQNKAKAEAVIIKIARALIFTQLFNLLLMIEQGTIDLAAFKTAIGMP